MTDRKQNRVRIDAITNAIRRGEYDDKLADLRGAIDARLAHKKQEVLALVQEIYGDGFTVTAARPAFGNGGSSVQIRSAGMPGESIAPVSDALGDDPEIESEFESRSPIIGAGNPG